MIRVFGFVLKLLQQVLEGNHRVAVDEGVGLVGLVMRFRPVWTPGASKGPVTLFGVSD